MHQLTEMSLGTMLKLLSQKTQFSIKQIKGIVSELSADALVNLKSAVDKGDIATARALLTSVSAEPVIASVDTIKQKLQALQRNKQLGMRSKINQMVNLISDLTDENWELIWPTLDQKLLASLWHQTSNRKTDTVSQKQASEILKYARKKLMEKMIYQDQIVEVKIPRGPNDTIGIVLDQKLTMVPRGECSPLHEHVLGMTGMPSLARMLMLAGVDTLPEAETTVRENKLPMGMRVVVEFDPNAPMDQTRVKILNVDSTITLEGLRSRIKRQFKELSADLQSNSPDYIFAVSNSQRLTNSLETMHAALQDLKQIREQGGTQSRNIPQVLEDENY